MAKPRLSIIGQRFWEFTVLKDAGNTPSGKSRWLVRCSCGREKILPATYFRKTNNPVKSCGCKRYQLIREGNSTHGMSYHPAYAVYRSMVDRCRLNTHAAWKNYGGRGIRVDSKWDSFERFWGDMGPTYRAGLTLERLDNSKGYSRENCAWKSRTDQARNTRRNRRVLTPWGLITVQEAAQRSEIGYSTLYYRIEHGVKGADLFTKPNTRNRFNHESI